MALAHERRAPVLFHAGRGIPHLGEAVVDLARRYPGARLILAHAGISDLGWIADEAAALQNLFFDTAWWNVADQLQLYSTIPPGRILYASDMPYAPGLLAAYVFLRVARAVGHGPEVLRSIAGEQLARVVAGEEPADLGPAPGPEAVGRRGDRGRARGHLLRRRAADRLPGHGPRASRSRWRGWRAGRAATATSAALLSYIDALLAIGQESAAAHPDVPFAIMPATLLAMVLAGTPEAGLPAVAV